MPQVTSGIRALLSSPRLYSGFQALMGARRFRDRFVTEFVRPSVGMNILDIGCGPADILAHLEGVNYWGFDISRTYIERAAARFGRRGSFRCKVLSGGDLRTLPPFDLVLAIGVIHHLDDDQALELLALARRALRIGGRVLTVDPCLEPRQNPIARFIITHDRGQNVRNRHAYEALLTRVFESPRVQVRHQAWVPYTHCYMEGVKRA